MNNVVAVLIAVVDAAAFSSAEKQKLVALMQSSQPRDEADSELSAPGAAACVSHSSDIVDVSKDLVDEAQTQLDETRHAESSAAHNFALLQQSLDAQSTQDNMALSQVEADSSESAQAFRRERKLILRRLRRSWQMW